MTRKKARNDKRVLCFVMRKRSHVVFMSLRGAVRRSNLSIISIMSKQYYVYIMTNKRNTVLYTGVTNDLRRRVYEHREKLVDGFTTKYNITKLVYYEIFQDPENAIMREKQFKAGSRQKKINFINQVNKEWQDLYEQL